MSTLHLTLSEAFSSQAADSLMRALDPHIKVETPEIYLRTPPSQAPQFIHAVGKWQLWEQSLGSFAADFVRRLGYRPTTIAWTDAARLLNDESIRPLAAVASALIAVKRAVKEPATIIVGLNIPNDRFGTVVVIDDDEAVKVAYGIARFVDRAREISTVISRAVAIGETPRGPALLSFEEDGGVTIRWASRADLREHEQRLPL